MITQRFATDIFYDPNINPNADYLNSDFKNRMPLGDAVDKGYLYYEKIADNNGVYRNYKFKVRKKGFITQNEVLSTVYGMKLDVNQDDYFCITQFPVKEGQEFIFYCYADTSSYESTLLSKLMFIPYSYLSNYCYIDFESVVYLPYATNWHQKEFSKDPAETAGYISVGKYVLTDDSGYKYYNVTFLRDCYVVGSSIYNPNLTNPSSVKRSNTVHTSFFVKAGKTVVMSGYNTIFLIGTSSFIPDIDFNNLYSLQKAKDNNILSDLTTVRLSNLSNSYNAYRIKANRNLIILGFYGLYSGETNVFNYETTAVDFLPVLSQETYYIIKDVINTVNDFSCGVIAVY